jgi:hypothetical protein
MKGLETFLQSKRNGGKSMTAHLLKHPLSPITRRSGLALIAIFVVMTVGTVGMKLLTGWDWVLAFYFMAMIATAEGPPISPPNASSAIFAAVMAFISIGTLITAIGTIFGPFLGYLFHKGVHFAERELEKKSHDKGILRGQGKEREEGEGSSSDSSS